MASGSLKQFLRKAKKTNQPIKKPTWKRWCIQLLTALQYILINIFLKLTNLKDANKKHFLIKTAIYTITIHK